MITGINHVTLAVRDLERSFPFYTRVLGLRPLAKWAGGAYLLAGDDWICLSLDSHARAGPQPEYTHLAFSVDAPEFAARADAIRASGAAIWKDNRSEGESLYFLDPDGHKLELHAGDLDSRLRALESSPNEGLRLYPRSPATADAVPRTDGPMDALRTLWAEARRKGWLPHRNAVCLSTIDADGGPDSRFVDLKDVDDAGLVFCTDLGSAKARQLAANPKACIAMWWEHVSTQVRISGTCTALSSSEADRHWMRRPAQAQLASVTFRQSRLLADAALLDEAGAHDAHDAQRSPIPRPDSWGGFRLHPEAFEFLAFRENRLHLRTAYTRVGDRWQASLLQP
jgi:pyridoxamine 5'-phosphate oxidase